MTVCDKWQRRGRPDAVRTTLLDFTRGEQPEVDSLRRQGRLPPWLGLEALHVSHRSSLVRKEPEHYRRFFPDVPDDLPYVWPPAAFPRWPVHRDRPLDVDEAATELAWDAPRPGQASAVRSLAADDDVVLDWPPGAGATSTGLLAALCPPGSTLWISPHAGPSDFTTPPLAELQPVPVVQRAGKVSASIARPPTEQDLAALARETTEPPEVAFHRPSALLNDAIGALVRKEPPSLIVLDGVSPEEARSVLDAAASGPVVLGIGGHLARTLPEAVRTAPNG